MRTPNSKEVLDRALCLAIGEYLKGIHRLNNKPIYQTPRIDKAVVSALEELPDGGLFWHVIVINEND